MYLGSEKKTHSSTYSLHQSSFKMHFTLILILGYCGKSIIGMLTLSPMMVAPVCLGGQVNLTCTASVEFIEWSFTVVSEQGRDEPFTVFSTSSGPSQQSMPIVVNFTNFTVIRNSDERSLPLISTLSISLVSIGLNGTVVNCMKPGNMLMTASTTIQVIDISNDQHSPALHITSKEYSTEYVTVTVEWAQEARATYTPRVLPPAPIMSTGNTSRQLKLLYNINYNFSVIAVIPCRSNITAVIGLSYSTCGPPNLLSLNSNNSVPRIEGYDGLPIEGSTIRFSCPPGLALTGPNLTTCTENGEWEPDPKGLMCIVQCEHPLFNNSVGTSLYYVLDSNGLAVIGTTVSFNCSEPREVIVGHNSSICVDNGRWEPDPSQISCKASCGTPETHNSVKYSNYNSTLEGDTISFWCIDAPFRDEEFTTTCMKNASWIPDPVRQCSGTTLRPDDEEHPEGFQTDRTAIIAGGLLGALAVILVILITVGAIVFIKKDMLSNHRNTLVLNTELNDEHAYNVFVHNQQNKETTGNLVYADLGSWSNDRSLIPRSVHDQRNKETAENIVYADVGPLSNNQSWLPGNSVDFDEHRVEYAQLNHKAKVSVPVSSADKAPNEDIALNLDSLLIQLQDKVTQDWHRFGVALGIENKILHRCLNYPPDQGIIEILDHWLRSDVERTWGEVARALRQINYHQLADNIGSIDKTGKLLIEVNVDEVPSDVLHRSQFDLHDDEPPPPIPPKRFEEDPEESQYEDVLRSCAAPIRPPKP